MAQVARCVDLRVVFLLRALVLGPRWAFVGMGPLDERVQVQGRIVRGRLADWAQLVIPGQAEDLERVTRSSEMRRSGVSYDADTSASIGVVYLEAIIR